MKDVAIIVKKELNEDKNKHDHLTRRQRSAIKRGDAGFRKYKSITDIKKAIEEFGEDNYLDINISDAENFKIKVKYNGRVIFSDVIALLVEDGKVYVRLSIEYDGLLKNLKDDKLKDFLKWFNEHCDCFISEQNQ